MHFLRYNRQEFEKRIPTSSIRIISILILLTSLLGGYDQPASAQSNSGSSYYISPSGSDRNPGTQSQPWKTIQKAADSMAAGGTAYVAAGSYPEAITVSRSQLTFIAQGAVTTQNWFLVGDSITMRGFTVTDPSSNWGIRTSGNHNLVEGNEIYHTLQDGIWFFGSYNTFRGNYIHDILDPSNPPTHIDCFQTWGWNWDTTNVLIERNICVHNPADTGTQFVMLERQTSAQVSDITFRNNIFVMYNPVFATMIFEGTGGGSEISNIAVINNTIVNMSQKRAEAISLTNITNASVVNNLFINFGDTITFYVDAQGASSANVHHNAVYNTGGTPPKGNPYPGDIWLQDPKVVNLAALDFHLQASSPLINKGTVWSGISADFEGKIRAIPPDIGAYEFPVNTLSVNPICPHQNEPLNINLTFAGNGQPITVTTVLLAQLLYLSTSISPNCPMTVAYSNASQTVTLTGTPESSQSCSAQIKARVDTDQTMAVSIDETISGDIAIFQNLSVKTILNGLPVFIPVTQKAY